MKKILITSTILISVIIFPITVFGSYDYTWSVLEKTEMVFNHINPETVDDTSNPLNLDCGSCILIEQHTGKVLYSYNCHEQLKPASVTKIMSIYLIMEAISTGKINYDTKIPCSANAESMGGSQIWLSSNEQLTVDEMLKAICVVSANDCVTAMAEYLGGTEESFVNMMNEKASSLGMKDTTFKNCHGIDEEGHVTSSYDIAILSSALLNDYPEITEYTTIYTDTLRDGKSSLVNTNKLVRNYPGCTGLKTGSTSLALYNLSASASRDGFDLIAVVMKAPTSKIRFKNASALLDYGFKNFEHKKLSVSGDALQSVKVNKGLSPTINAIVQEDCIVILEKGQNLNIEQTISLPDNISAPILQGQTIGNVTYTLNGETLAECNLLADKSIDKINWFSMNKLIFKNWFCLFRT